VSNITSSNATTKIVTVGQGSFSLTSDAGVDGGTLPVEYTGDGSGISPPLAWSNAPAGTREFALMMTTLPGDGSTKWSWVLYSIPGTTTSLAKNSSGVGILGVNHRGTRAYEPPASQGPGAKIYTFTVYALSASPVLPAADQVTGAVLTQAIASITLGSASLSLSYTRPGTALSAAFTFAPGAPVIAQTVAFTDNSTGSPTSWSWSFGDGSTSTIQNPTHAYSAAGSYAVTLTVSNAGGSSNASKTLTVNSAGTLVGDVNGDGRVDMRDMGYVARRFMCVPGDPLWDPTADFNSDGKIDMVDIGTVARHFGESLP
jgi:phosphatidylethanolamine-binding protein (PEBP) family uncharacterized protein